MKRLAFLCILILTNTTLFSQNPEKLMKDILSPYHFKNHTAIIDSLEISYIKEGSGKTTLLFVHGLSSNADAWYKNIETLKQTYTCIALDLPGYGKSSKPKADYTPSYFADHLNKFIEKLDLNQVVLIGHSMGGQASVKLAVNYPEAIEKLILVAPAGLEQFSEINAGILKGFFTPEVIKNTTDQQIEKNYALNFYVQPKEAFKMINDRKQNDLHLQQRQVLPVLFFLKCY